VRGGRKETKIYGSYDISSCIGCKFNSGARCQCKMLYLLLEMPKKLPVPSDGLLANHLICYEALHLSVKLLRKVLQRIFS
jgi:hypothetical protein